MPNVNAQFGGQTLTQPGSYYVDNVSATAQTGQAQVPPAVVVCNAYGIPPLVPVTFYTLQDATNAVKGGPVSAFLPFLYTPSTELNGASAVTFINAAQNTQATFPVLNGAPATAINLTSTQYGPSANLLQIEIGSGSVGGKYITLLDGYTGATVAADNLGLPFQLAYAGTATGGVTYTVTVAGGVATGLTVTSPNAGESLMIALGAGQYSTVGQVVAYLNGTGFYDAVIWSNPNLPAASLDAAAAVALPIPASGVYSYVPVTAKLTDVAYWFNNVASALATAAVVTGVGGTIANIPLTHFSGATAVPPTLSNYASALNLALTQPGWVVFADANFAGVAALGAQHAITASAIPNRRWRRFITGSQAGDSVAVTVANTAALNAFQATYCYPGLYANSPVTGLNTLYPGLYVAAATTGMMAGNPVATALTNKSVIGTGVELIGGLPLSTSQLALLQNSGVQTLTVPDSTGVPTILSDVTTWQNDDNPENVFNQQVGCRQFLSYVLQQAGAPYIGSIASPFGQRRIKNAFTKALNSMIYTEGGNGVLVSWDPTSLVLNFTGSNQVESVTVAVVFVGQVRFLLTTALVQPLNL